MEWLQANGASLVDKAGQAVDVASLDGKVVAFYFSSSWCGDCTVFTPYLVDFYDVVKDKGFEIVFVSSDEDEEKRAAYMAKSHGTWLSLRHEGDKDLRGELKRKYGACAGREQGPLGVSVRREGIPCLAVVKPCGTLLTIKGAQEVKEQGPNACLKKWKKGKAFYPFVAEEDCKDGCC